MPCFSPLKAYRSESDFTLSGKRKIIFKESCEVHSSLLIPCGQCIGCRLERSRQWAVRCMHEASLHENNCFITLTIDESQNEIRKTSLIKADFQKFMKRLRKRFPPDLFGHIGYYYCGEYGDRLGRPHYHACLFGFDFSDKKFWKRSGENNYFVSDELNKLWGKGYCIIGDVTFESAAYVARYITKKITGKDADEYYAGRQPEYTNMSKKPAIGLNWVKKYHSDIYSNDEMIVRGKKVRPTSYYDKFYEKHFPEKFDEIKSDREFRAFEFNTSDESSIQRLITKHECKILQSKNLVRPLESSSIEFSSYKQSQDEKILQYQKETLCQS
jgi:hypothetical protein